MLFVLGCGVIMSMYGGGFATIPAYLRDLFGTGQVGAIHGRLLTAWSAAGIAGPVARQLHPRVPDPARRRRRPTPTRSRCTSWPGCSLVGFVCNALTRPLPAPESGLRR